MLTSLNTNNQVKIVQFHEKVVMIIASLINYKPWGSFVKLNVSNGTVNLRPWVTENKITEQQERRKEKQCSLKYSFLSFQKPFFWYFKDIYTVNTDSRLKKIITIIKTKTKETKWGTVSTRSSNYYFLLPHLVTKEFTARCNPTVCWPQRRLPGRVSQQAGGWTSRLLNINSGETDCGLPGPLCS